MDPLFGVSIVIAIAGLSVALSISAATSAIRDLIIEIRRTSQIMSDILRIRIDELIKTIKDK